MLTYDDDKDQLVFATGKRIYCYGGNPSIGLYKYEAMSYSYGSDGGFNTFEDTADYALDITIDEAIEIADAMIDTWIKHKQFLVNKKGP
jgi:hypothetical protein